MANSLKNKGNIRRTIKIIVLKRNSIKVKLSNSLRSSESVKRGKNKSK